MPRFEYGATWGNYWKVICGQKSRSVTLPARRLHGRHFDGVGAGLRLRECVRVVGRSRWPAAYAAIVSEEQLAASFRRLADGPAGCWRERDDGEQLGVRPYGIFAGARSRLAIVSVK